MLIKGLKYQYFRIIEGDNIKQSLMTEKVSKEHRRVRLNPANCTQYVEYKASCHTRGMIFRYFPNMPNAGKLNDLFSTAY